ncbi:TM2 domain-containing protein [Acinetobacter rathckeae]|uniref:TM2 domain-containing protein n=1 Tax=Acinetobacter rathckeae TaxID=2605272 RepID=UPI0018A32BB0|nr:TM2 domain-containing protein [Acinetobacter rathckeae]MBF7688675.1 TM2 domain-containing protein [Acinetobacter rathckeae]MBF7696068.1 TM2 domain-containing protein [Acinetobacter rathckeae]
MKGTILDFSIQQGSGLIAAEDDQRYEFKKESWKDHSAPQKGMTVDFSAQYGQAQDIYIISTPTTIVYQQIGTKNRIVAALLAFFLGGFGAHKFYLGQIGWGFVYLLFCWTFIPAFVAFIEFIIYLCTSDEKFAAKYG